VMAVTRAQFRTVSAHESMPERIITRLNDTMSEGNDSNMFVTLFVGVLDLPTGRLRYCNAGHDAPMLIGSNIGMLPCDSNLPVGVMGDWKFLDGVDVLITHRPPLGIMDTLEDKIHYGSSVLLDKVSTIKPRLHLFGHVHGAYGSMDWKGTTFSNAGLTDWKYNMCFQPRLLTI
ncbi:MAG: SpoIIE family protein phosphatase, partial [Paludibacteraceae bacterium]|nr:SpoIIE family protein phosphatase [Paludibacteraceae bacterium]